MSRPLCFAFVLKRAHLAVSPARFERLLHEESADNQFSIERKDIPVGRFTRRHFIAATSAAAGALSLNRRVGLAQPSPSESDELKLWYTAPASQWVDALPIGNGRLGAMVFGGGAIDPIDPRIDHEAEPVATDPAKETLVVNEDTLWSGFPVDGNNLDAKNHLAAVRRAVLEEKDYHLADRL
jgi:alpha-L-fucosidase 2